MSRFYSQEHPANQEQTRRETHRRALKHDQESRRSGVFPDRGNVVPLQARGPWCPVSGHEGEFAETCIHCADMEVDA